MKLFKDKQGNKLTAEEFFGRWKEGMRAITPKQQSGISLMGNFIVITGIIWGIVVIFFTEMWWLFVILIGSLIVSLVATLGTWQKYVVYKELDERMRLVEEVRE